eukprot:2501411-Pyramimonas_sp.AAC.1
MEAHGNGSRKWSDKLLRWLEELFLQLPSRRTPIFMVAGNFHCGYRKTGHDIDGMTGGNAAATFIPSSESPTSALRRQVPNIRHTALANTPRRRRC